MCGFVISTKKLTLGGLCQRRGPDATQSINAHGINFVHHLLDISGKRSLQPFIDYSGDIFCVYNGEIYNYDSLYHTESDGEVLIPLYKSEGANFARHLDGEFASCIFDFSKNILIVSRDCFGTKPLWLGVDGKDFALASYISSLFELNFKYIVEFPVNRTYVFSLDNLELVEEFEIKTFNLKQYKRNYDDWIDAFTAAIAKRTLFAKDNLFIGLSSGYDSGAIAQALTEQTTPFKAYAFLATENESIIMKRKKALFDCDVITISQKKYSLAQEYLKNYCENYMYDAGVYNSIIKDSSSPGWVLLCHLAKKEGKKIMLSGSGADETISDYGFKGVKSSCLSCFGGLFPKDLKTIFPWKNFFKGSQEAFIRHDDHIGGAHGIEVRFPFLDPLLVQEFLHLDVELKNSQYKAPLHHYLSLKGVPFNKGKKIGFKFKNEPTSTPTNF